MYIKFFTQKSEKQLPTITEVGYISEIYFLPTPFIFTLFLYVSTPHSIKIEQNSYTLILKNNKEVYPLRNLSVRSHLRRLYWQCLLEDMTIKV